MPAAKKSSARRATADVLAHVEATSATWQTRCAAKLADLRENCFRHYAPSTAAQAYADVKRAKEAGITDVDQS